MYTLDMYVRSYVLLHIRAVNKGLIFEALATFENYSEVLQSYTRLESNF